MEEKKGKVIIGKTGGGSERCRKYSIDLLRKLKGKGMD